MPHLRFPEIDGQRGFATTSQLLAAGWTYSALSHLVATTGSRVLPRVYLPHQSHVAADDITVAGWLWAGHDTALTGTRALARHGLALTAFSPITRFLTRRNGRNRETIHGMELRRTRRAPRASVRDDVAVAPVERALVDAARYKEASARDITGWTIAALQRRLTTLDRLDAEVTASGWIGLGAVTDGCAAFRRGAWSLPEATLGTLVAEDPRFPRMLPNPRLEDESGVLIGRPDGYFEEEGVVVQVHSRAFHDGEAPDGRDRWNATVQADNRYTAVGLAVIGVTPTALAESPTRFLDELAATLVTHRGRAPKGVRVVLDAPPGDKSG